jgi:Flp pilus assembly protein TadB
VLWTTPLGRILLLLMAVLEAAGAYAVRAVSRVDV